MPNAADYFSAKHADWSGSEGQTFRSVLMRLTVSLFMLRCSAEHAMQSFQSTTSQVTLRASFIRTEFQTETLPMAFYLMHVFDFRGIVYLRECSFRSMLTNIP